MNSTKKTNKENESLGEIDGFGESCEIGFEEIEMVLSSKKKGDRKLLQGIKGKASPGRMVCFTLQFLLKILGN